MSKDKPNCKASVMGAGCWRSRRCSRYAVKDGYCNQHHPDTIAAKDAASKAKQVAWSQKFTLKRDVHHGERAFTDAFREYMQWSHDPAVWAKAVTAWNTVEAARAELKEVQNDE